MDLESGETDRYVQELTSSQGRLRAYILASLGNYADTADVLQRTNLALWRKASEFRSEAPFLPWALSIARFEILAFIRDAKRDRHVFASDVTALLADMAADVVANLDSRREALRICMEKLPRRNRDLLWLRYSEEQSIRQLAESSQRSEDAVKSLLLRIRRTLERCIETRLRAVESTS
jgi:RNA polymerase sigma-70 factor (ECF subfamily)